MYINTCKYCKKELEFDNRFQFSAHNTSCEMNPTKIERDRKNKQKKEISTYEVKCIKCKQLYLISTTCSQFERGDYSKHCTRKCANTHILSEQTKLKISNAVTILNTSSVYFKNCIVCEKLFTVHIKHSKKCCSKECTTKRLSETGVISGRKSAASQSLNRRSKNEIEFANLCIAIFKNVECNVPIFNGWDADIIIHDLKIAVLWNGKWHYEKITQKHSVTQVQNRDKIKTNEITKFGYTPYIIKDLGNDKDIVLKEFEKFCSIYR